MGKCDTNKATKHPVKPYRKTVLGSNNLAIFLRPSLVDIISSSSSSSTQQLANDDEKIRSDTLSSSATNLFEMLKDTNKIMVKGTKLYESLKELRLSGWIMPCTLILSGPLEDMKVVKHAWVKRHLKSPQGYFIRDLGMVQDFVVELISQSPFMSLTTALFDAVSDLNHQNIFPTKHNVHEYLKKHYPEIKTPEMRVIHECLGRLIKQRRLYHNGRGYFVLCNENVLNEVFSAETLQLTHEESVVDMKGFTAGSSMTTSSSPGQTDLEINAAAHKITPEVTSLDSGAGTPYNIKKLFKRSKKSDKKFDNKLNKPKVFSCGIGGTMTDSVTILSNKPISMNASMPISADGTKCTSLDQKKTGHTYSNNAIVDEHCSSDSETVPEQSFSDVTVKASERTKVKRSRSFGGKDNKKSHKEVSFALFGSPTHDCEGDIEAEEKNYFKKRSYSFGVGYAKSMYQRPIRHPRIELSSATIDINDAEISLDAMDMDDMSTYVDVENSFVDDSLPLVSKRELIHEPDMRPLEQKQQLFNYEDLGSELSLQIKTVPFSVSDLASPPKTESLATELRDAYSVKEQCIDACEVDRRLLSPRSRRKFGGTPYESHYIEELLDNEKVYDENMNNLSNTKSDTQQGQGFTKNEVESKSEAVRGVKVRSRSKSAEQRKKNQKERNSLLFEEKRASLTVMGMV